MPPQVHGNALPEGYRLHWYRIGHVLGQGGFGITYLATDDNLGRAVAIKEYLPVELAVREGADRVRPFTEDRKATFLWGLESFLVEARTLARMNHPNIVRVLSVFEANDTAYMVMEYEQGSSLSDLIKFNRIEGEESLRRVVLPLLDGLQYMHDAGFIHRDIKPDNIYVRANGSPVLLDFGSARMALSMRTRELTALVSPGFSPYEQYHAEEGRQGPWTDIYSLGATLYSALEMGRPPVDAIARANARIEHKPDPLKAAASVGAGRYPVAFLGAIDAALGFTPAERPQTIAEWRSMFKTADIVEGSDEVPTQRRADVVAEPGPGTPRRAMSLRVVMLAGTLAALVVGSWWLGVWQERPRIPAPEAADGTADVTAPEKVVSIEAPVTSVSPAPTDPVGAPVPPVLPGSPQTDTLQSPSPSPSPSPSLGGDHRALAGADSPATLPDLTVGDAHSVTGPKVRAGTQSDAGEAGRDIGSLLEDAKRAIAALRLTSPAGDNALERYRAVLALDPENAHARRGLERIVDRYVELADVEAGRGRFEQAVAFLDRAEGVLPGAEVLAPARERVSNRAAASMGKAEESPVPASQARSAAVPAHASFRDRLDDGSEGPEMVRIPPGRFAMGSPPGERGRKLSEGPVHDVTVTAGYALGRYEVTVAEFRRFVDASGYRTRAEILGGCFVAGDKRSGATWRAPGYKRQLTDSLPVVCVAWKDAVAYADWLSARSGAHYRLPGETEWEYAARAGTVTAGYWGDDPDAACGHANVGDAVRVGNGAPVTGTAHACRDGAGGPARVGTYKPNAFGLHDMLGNVWELTSDCWRDSYAQAAAANDEGCRARSRRGGSFSSGTEEARTAARKPGGRPAVAVGFRVARDL